MQLDNLETCEDWIELCDGSMLKLMTDGSCEFEDLTPRALAHHLSGAIRWGGAAREPMTVAQHSLGVTDTVAAFGGGVRLQVLAMLHDAHEPFMGGDRPTPMKRWARRAFQDAGAADASPLIADAIDAAVQFAFGIMPPSLSECEAIKQADTLALAAERRDLFDAPPRDNWTARLPSPAAIARIEVWPWQMARAKYAERLDKLLTAYAAEHGL